MQEGQLSVSGERMCTSNGLPLTGLSLSRKSVVSRGLDKEEYLMIILG